MLVWSYLSNTNAFFNIISIILVIGCIINDLPDFDNDFLSITIFCMQNTVDSYKYPAYRATFRLMAENVIAPLGNFASLSYLKEDSKLRLLIDFCTMFAGVLVSDSLLHMLPY